MKKILSVSILAFVSAIASGADLYRAPLPELDGAQEVLVQEVVMPPGFDVPAHRHDSLLYVYVLEGEVEMQLEGAEVQLLKAGDVFTEDHDDVHTVMRNPSDSVTARFLSFTIKPADIRGFELVTPAAP